MGYRIVVTVLVSLAAAPIAAQDTIPPKRRPPVADSLLSRDSTTADSARRDSTRSTRATTRSDSLWPVKMPDPLPGSLLPGRRIVAYYGNPLSKRMGILGAVSPDSMLARLDREVAAWSAADTMTPVQPALHLIAVVAQASPGRDGKYRLRMDSALIERVYEWAQRRNAILFLDIQLGRSSLEDELAVLASFLRRPNVHLGLDPEFAMGSTGIPGKRVGSLDARDVEKAMAMLADIVTRNELPPKVLVVHRFTRDMLTNSRRIRLDPRVQLVIHMDGWGPPWMKRESYRRYIHRYPVQFTGFKLFYRNDRRGGGRLMTPAEVLKLHPKPVYIQYQ